MYTDRGLLEKYPYEGTFYEMEIDESLPLTEQVEKKVVYFQSKCDIIEATHNVRNNFITAKYVVYLPLKEDEQGLIEPIPIQVGNLFESKAMGFPINGKVIGLFPSQMKGLTIYIEDLDN